MEGTGLKAQAAAKAAGAAQEDMEKQLEEQAKRLPFYKKQNR